MQKRVTCLGFSFARNWACGAGTGRNLGAGAAVGGFLHVCLPAVSGDEAELRVESHRALRCQTEKRSHKAGCGECGSGGEGRDSFLSDAGTPLRRHLDFNAREEKKETRFERLKFRSTSRGEDERSPRGAHNPPQLSTSSSLWETNMNFRKVKYFRMTKK